MLKPSTRSMRLILGEARTALGMTQREFGEAVRASHRSAVRWEAGQATPAEHQLRTLAALLYPTHRELAREVASLVFETLESLGLEAPPPPLAPAPPLPPLPAPAPPPFVPRDEDLVDVVVCAAVEATGQSPAALRPLIYKLFKRAREVGLSTLAVEKALEPAAHAPANG
jgi:transcriptional regulator with XRE-family HTH domain